MNIMPLEHIPKRCDFFLSLRTLTKIEIPGGRMEYLMVFLSIGSGSQHRLSTGRDSN
jgi:hypothetical protein